jgi:hypothetical protein
MTWKIDRNKNGGNNNDLLHDWSEFRYRR